MRILREVLAQPVMWHRARRLAKFLDHARSCQKSQLQTLEHVLQVVEGSQFAKDFGLRAGLSVDDLRQALPVAGFERFAPYIERVKKGQLEALFSQSTQVVMFATTSGTTAAAKYIPITKDHLDDYRESWTHWARLVARDFPHIAAMSVLNLASSWSNDRTQFGIPCGSISGMLFATTHATMRAINAIPPETSLIENNRDKYYTTLRLALAKGNLAAITTANPTTLVKMARWMDDWKEDLVRDVHDGTLKTMGQLPAKARKSIRWRVWSSKGRAKFLENIIRTTGTLFPKDAWPELELLGVWTGGTLGSYLSLLPPYYGDVPCRDHGLSASEARMTLPLENSTSSGVLNTKGGFYEFIPVSEYEAGNHQTLLAHELDLGAKYYVIISNLAGLIRYDIHDVVECTGFFGEAPLLRFLHKGSQIANLTGEKLSAFQIDQAMGVTRRQVPMSFDQYAVVPIASDPSYYRLLVESWSDRAGERFLTTFDQNLCEGNIEYRDKRESERLGPVEVQLISPGSWENLRKRHMNAIGGTMEQYKQPCLIKDPDLIAELTG